MAWAEKQLKRNAFNEIVPQYFDEALDDWVPYTGVYGEVTLSGNKTEVVFARNIYTSDQQKEMTVPDYVKGAIITYRVHALTGAFEAGEGIRFVSLDYVLNKYGDISNHLAFDYINHVCRYRQYRYPGVDSLGDVDTTRFYTYEEIQVSPLPLGSILRIRMDIKGSFGTGEGIDAEVNLKWLI